MQDELDILKKDLLDCFITLIVLPSHSMSNNMECAR